MEIVYFIYGLSFFVFGVVDLFVPTKDSNLFFANKIWLLGMFAISHAFVEWTVLYRYVHKEHELFLISFEIILLFVSYIFLFEFSRFILRKSFENPYSKWHFIYHIYAAPVIYIIATALLVTYLTSFPGLEESIVAIRYTYGFWGALFLGIGLYFYSNTLKDIESIIKIKLYLKIAGITFLFYAFFAGLVVPPANTFPANYLNEEWFINTFNIPVQVFRALCAIVIAFSSIKVLDIFRTELNVKLQKSFQQIKEFNSNASHQLKTPLSSMKVQIDVTLQKNRSQEEYQEVLKSINEEVYSLQELVSNLLTLTRMQDKTIKDTFEKVSIDNILLDIIGEYMIIANEKSIQLDIEELEDCVIDGNKTLINILITNIIDNAIKYTPNNKTIFISLKDETLTIKDQGIGIEKEKLNSIFDKFYQVAAKENKTFKGYGLGLPMVKKIVKLHDASIFVESKKDEGSTFFIKFNSIK